MWKIEADEEAEPIKEAPEHARAELKRIRWDTFIGMAISNLVGIAIIMRTAATLHAGGKTEVSRAADVAEALKPVVRELMAAASYAAEKNASEICGKPIATGIATAGQPDVGAGTRVLTGGDRGYMNHPAFGAALKEIDPQTNTPPSKKLSRTKAPNRETAIRGEHGQDQMLRKSARTNRNIMPVPWNV